MKEKRKVAFVTGASRGIGASIAKELAKNGFCVAVNYQVREEDASQVKTWIESHTPMQAILIPGDISQEDVVKQIIEKTEQELGPIDLLVNNAAIAIDTLVEEKRVEDFKRILEVNLLGTFLCCKYIGERMKERKQGNIINISSTNGIDTGYPEGMDYDASKAGVISLTQNFAKELAPFVRVNSVAPGWVLTDMNETLEESYKRAEEEKILLGRFASAEEIAKVVAFLACEDASYINGTVIRVDGGRR